MIAKFSAGCDRGVSALVAEAVSAMLAADLDLPVPEPMLVAFSSSFIDAVPDSIAKNLMRRSVSPTFGSKKLPPGFSVWPCGRPIPRSMIQVAADVFAFDALIDNDDRRPDNPNCLVKGDAIAIIDHDLAFASDMMIGWREPWHIGALDRFRQPGHHIFHNHLRGNALDYSAFAARWGRITDDRLSEYKAALPTEWADGAAALASICTLIAGIRDNIAASIAEVVRVLR